MNAPDKIYISQDNLRDKCWGQNKCSDVEFINKNTLLEWTKEKKKKYAAACGYYYDGVNDILDSLLTKLKSL